MAPAARHWWFQVAYLSALVDETKSEATSNSYLLHRNEIEFVAKNDTTRGALPT